MNDRDNDHVTLAEVDGFIAEDLHGALEEAEAISMATQCTKFLFSVSLNPPEGVVVTEEGFKEVADRVAETLGLSEQPRAIVIHEKNGRRHAHAVWSRIDGREIKAIELGLYKVKLRDLSRELFLDHGWELPKGLQTYGHKDPLNFTLGEWQQAQRIGVDPREMKPLFQNAWARSDSLKSLTNALSDKGLYLAKGDRRGFVALDIEGKVYALARWSGVKTKELKAKLGSPDNLPSVEATLQILKSKKTKQVTDYIDQVKGRHAREIRPFVEDRAKMVKAQRKERANLKAKQEDRWINENKERQERLNGGLRGLFDRITGAHRKTQKTNERESLACLHRDQEQRDTLIHAQMAERRTLLERALPIRKRHKQDRSMLAKTVNLYLRKPTSEPMRNRSPGLALER
ncbi:MAG: relaxase/mobilization nuclease domain-containing protein [Pseudomonadota bacterium]